MAHVQVHYQDYEELVELLQTSEQSYDMEKIDKAYHFALYAHGDQRRISGIPYILHPTSVACILVDLGMDTDCIIAALLHDVVEDTPVTLDEVSGLFGSSIARLIDGVTKLGKLPTNIQTKEEQQAENVRKMMFAMQQDIRVIIIKLADRLHNMRTIECMKEQKRRDKALETMEVFAPIAHRLGIRKIKEELEDLSLQYLDPIAYADIEKSLTRMKEDREQFIESIKQRIKDRISDAVPNAYIEGRVKSINGIYRKTIVQGKTIEQIYDIFAVRVIVDTVADCYNVLGFIHEIFQLVPNRFKDYISMPKPNMYQSLHSTVIGREGIPFEVQIRTWDMHHTAEYGIAAHYKYKHGLTQDGNKKNLMEEKLTWIRKILENQNEDDAVELVKNIKTDLVPEEVFVLTPKGDVITLPQGATVIDMAYAIHSAVGNRMIGAKVNNRIVPIDYQVKTGEIVEIITTKEEVQGPRRDWLKIVKTSEARGKIRQWFKREKRDENIVEGKSELDRELRRNGIIIPEKDLPTYVSEIMKRNNCNTIEDFYAAIGYGGVQIWRFLPRLKDEYNKRNAPTVSEPAAVIKSLPEKKKPNGGVIIEGVNDVLIKLSKCCNPLPGDDIIGFITRGYGVSIHKRSCTNVPEDLANALEPERWVNAYWEGEIKDEFQSTLEIIASDRRGLLADITNQLSAMHIYIHALNSREVKNNQAAISATITVSGKEHLRSVIQRLEKIKGITSITRS